jgi:hypothetical protein
MRFLLALLSALLLASPVMAIEKEYIIISGGPSMYAWEKFKAQPHDKWWGNFIRTARVRIQELQAKHGPDVPITWLVYKDGYIKRGQQDNQDYISNILSVRDKYHVKLIFFDKGKEVIDYFNHGQPRDKVKIANFEFYGHSNAACFLFDYSNIIDSASKSWLHETDFKKFNRGIFTKDAFVKSWGCHTGESMSKKFRAATGIKMYGAIGKTDYSNGTFIVLSKPGDRWTY